MQVAHKNIGSDAVDERRMFNPFPGLRPFSIEESHLFFGREGQSDDIVRRLSDNKFVAVIGSSGSGKSSLIYCGLIPLLKGGFVGKKGVGWKVLTMRPGSSPIKNMAKSLVSNDLEPAQAVVELKTNEALLRSNSLALSGILKQINEATGENVLILVDQFEELFRYKSHFEGIEAANESAAFVKLLLETVADQQLPAYVVITMRSDFIGDCAQYPELTDLINTSQYLIPQMTRENLKRAIAGPVAVGGGKISSRLLHNLLNETGDNPDALPVLQHSLMRTWNHWVEHGDASKPMDIEHYDAIGQMERALSDHANEAYNELDERGKQLCESIFKTLTEKGADNRGVRRPTRIDVIAAIAGAGVDEIIGVVEVFRKPGRSFLTPPPHVSLTGFSIVDISHESLMRVWDRLRIWVEEEADSVEMYLKLCESAALYQEGKTGLWRPPDLQLALNWKLRQNPNLVWAKRYHPAFEPAIEFLETGKRVFEAEEENKQKLQKRALRRSKIFAVVLGTVSIISLCFLIFSLIQQQEAETQKRLALKSAQEAEAQKVIAQNKEKEALLLQKEAEKQKQLAELQREEAEKQREEAEKQKEIALQQTLLALQNEREAVKQKEIANQKTIEALQQREFAERSEKDALEQRTVAEKASGQAKNLRMLSIAQSMAVKSIQINRDTNQKALVAFQAYQFNKEYGGNQHHPDVYDGLYYTLKVLNPEDYNALKGHTGAVRALGYNKSGDLLSAGSEGKVLIHRKGAAPAGLTVSTSILRDLKISPSGALTAVSDESGVVRIYNSMEANAQPIKSFIAHKGAAWNMAFTPDEKYLITTGMDSTVKLWDIKAGSSELISSGNFRVKAVAVSPDGKMIAGATDDGKVVTWNIKKGTSSLQVLFDETMNSMQVVAYSGDGKWLAAGDRWGYIRIWDAKNFSLLYTLSGHTARINDLKFSPDNTMMASAGFDGSVHLWLTAKIEEQPVVMKDHSSWVWSLAFSADSEKLIAGCVDNLVRVWPTKAESMAGSICGKIKRNMSAREWERFVAEDIAYELTCPDLPQGE